MFLTPPRPIVALFVVAACGPASEGPGGDAGALLDGSVTAVDAACIRPTPHLADCAAPLAPGDERVCTVTAAGVTRTYLMYAPPSYDPCEPAALFVDAHGSSENASQQAGAEPFFDYPRGIGSGFRLVADREGFLVATPQGVNDRWTQADVAFMQSLPSAVAAQATLDPERVYMTGISLGAAVMYWTGCTTPNPFRGFAAVSGTDETGCTPAQPASYVQFHTPDDPVADYADALATFERWRTANHCAPQRVASWTFGGASSDTRPVCLSGGPPWQLVPCETTAPATTCERWNGCDGGGSAMFCTVPGDNRFFLGLNGGHVLYFNRTALSVAAVTWAFLSE
jgi:poly(3-hydroxybutyrate) depolymerase